ncbi:hypothetical protein BpHYR1_043178 [Brachionus plicatilis]|uniref:Uncharacterized protein n=1 Tax=Brachionus plicatilis TaxID=10195 RepID=A0A3M7R9G5_BRAPC|nr:hypothetical protein BpHYR1_043178 [Brachionus plicatilis]
MQVLKFVNNIQRLPVKLDLDHQEEKLLLILPNESSQATNMNMIIFRINKFANGGHLLIASLTAILFLWHAQEKRGMSSEPIVILRERIGSCPKEYCSY